MGAPMLNSSKKKKNTQHVSFTSNRRFGIELELNSFDGQNRPPKGDQPVGIQEISAIVAKAAPESGCEIRAWEHTNNNVRWVAKPDSSCGLEVVSPPKKGWKGLKEVLHVVYALKKDKRVKTDHRCSVHLHVEIDDLSETDLASIVSWWVKCEPVIMDAMPINRKRNRYCQLIGMNNTFQHDVNYSDKDLIQKVGDVKYYSFNTHQYCRSGRKTIEFRTIEGDGCQDPYLVKQWIRFIIHFVEIAVATGRPKPYLNPKNDEERKSLTPWTGLSWLDPADVLTFLGFNGCATIPDLRKETDYTLSKGMEQTKNWFLARLLQYMSRHKPGGMRYYALQQLKDILTRENITEEQYDKFIATHLSPSEMAEDKIFGDDYRF